MILKKEEIQNFELIIELITKDSNFENIGDIIFLLDRHDKFRENDDPELKRAVFSIVNEVLEREIACPIFGYSPIAPMPNPIPTTSIQVLEYLNKYWDMNSGNHRDIGRAHLIFFSKKSSPLSHNWSK